MTISTEQLVQIRDTVYADPSKLLKVNTVGGKSGKWDYCVVHSDGRALGVDTFRSPACHVGLNVLKDRTSSKCIEQRLSVPVAIIQSVPQFSYLKVLQDLELTEDEIERWFDFVLNKSLFKNMFLIKDAKIAMQQGFVVRTDVHPDWVLRTCSFLRKIEEGANGFISWYRNLDTDIPEDLSWFLGYNCFSIRVNMDADGPHSCLGVSNKYGAKNVREFFKTFTRMSHEGIVSSTLDNPDTWYMHRCVQEFGWLYRFADKVQDSVKVKCNSFPDDIIPEVNTGMRNTRAITFSNVHEVVRTMYERYFND